MFCYTHYDNDQCRYKHLWTLKSLMDVHNLYHNRISEYRSLTNQTEFIYDDDRQFTWRIKWRIFQYSHLVKTIKKRLKRNGIFSSYFWTHIIVILYRTSKFFTPFIFRNVERLELASKFSFHSSQYVVRAIGVNIRLRYFLFVDL